MDEPDHRFWGNFTTLWQRERAAWRRGFLWGVLATGLAVGACYLAGVVP